MKYALTFINGDPPPDGRTAEHDRGSHLIFLVGQLTALRDTRWATVDGVKPENAAATAKKLRAKGEELGLPIDAVCRSGVVYVRLGEGS